MACNSLEALPMDLIFRTLVRCDPFSADCSPDTETAFLDVDMCCFMPSTRRLPAIRLIETLANLLSTSEDYHHFKQSRSLSLSKQEQSSMSKPVRILEYRVSSCHLALQMPSHWASSAISPSKIDSRWKIPGS